MSAALKKLDQPPLEPAKVVEVEKLKAEQTTITAEIDRVKAQTVRGQDENTRVFNLRQAQLVQRIRDLEMRKIRTEKELNAIQTQKNTSIHEDLRKATLVLVNETKKIVPLEKEIESSMSKINSLKNEMQALFESSNDERKKNQGAIASQSKDIQALTEMVKACTSVINEEFKKATSDLEPLLKEKAELFVSLTKHRDDCTLAEIKLKSLDGKLTQLDKTYIEKSEAITKLENKISAMGETERKLQSLNEQITELQAKKQFLTSVAEKSEAQISEMNHSARRLESSLMFLHEQHDRKKDYLTIVEKEIASARTQLDQLKIQEAGLLRSCATFQGSLNQLEAQFASLEAKKDATIALQVEAQAFFHERQAFYQSEVKNVEENFKIRATQMEQNFKAKEAEWEAGFKTYAEGKEAALKTQLEAFEEQSRHAWTTRQGEFIKAVTGIMSKQFTRETFATPDQKVQDMKIEVEALYKEFFAPKTAAVSKKWWKFW